MLFRNILGQDSAIETIKRALRADKVPHAYLFVGPDGIGKHSAARGLAMALNCQERIEDACGQCRNCRKLLNNSHPDLIEVTVPQQKTVIPVDAIRVLEQRLSLRPHEGNAKVAIVDPADLMGEAAANAVLKTLEEPRPQRYLILISSRLASLLPTVRSRCQIVRFRALDERTLCELLIRRGIDDKEAARVAGLSGGSLNQAELYLSEDLESRMAQALTVLESILDSTPERGFEVSSELSGKRDETLMLLDLINVLLGEALWAKTHPELCSQLEAGPLQRAKLTQLTAKLSVARLASHVAAVHLAIERIKRNNMNTGLALEGMLLAMRGRTNALLQESAYGVL